MERQTKSTCCEVNYMASILIIRLPGCYYYAHYCPRVTVRILFRIPCRGTNVNIYLLPLVWRLRNEHRLRYVRAAPNYLTLSTLGLREFLKAPVQVVCSGEEGNIE